MLTMREGVTPLLGALAAACLASSALRAQQSEPYPATLYFGTGLITIPVAWVSPRSADVWINTSAKNLPSIPNSGAMTWMTRMNSNISIDTHWGGRASVGAVAYSQNPEWGFFGQLLAVRQGDFATYMPSLAVGLRNVGKYKHEDRFFIGEDITLGANGYHGFVADRYKGFNTANTVYGVATEQFSLGSSASSSGLSASVGWGNGLFRDDGDLGSAYNRRGTIVKGLFAGLRFVTHPSLNTTLSVLAENDGWDYNAGVQVDWRGLTAGVYGTELEEGGGRGPSGFFVYNYAKYNIALGYSGNIIDISKGVILRTRITELTREQQRLRYEVAERNRRIRGLELALTRAQASEVAGLERRKSDLERQVQEERDAIRRAEDRLRQLEQNQTKPPATPVKPPTPPSL
jgi:hypothetical protein